MKNSTSMGILADRIRQAINMTGLSPYAVAKSAGLRQEDLPNFYTALKPGSRRGIPEKWLPTLALQIKKPPETLRAWADLDDLGPDRIRRAYEVIAEEEKVGTDMMSDRDVALEILKIAMPLEGQLGANVELLLDQLDAITEMVQDRAKAKPGKREDQGESLNQVRTSRS